MNPVLIIFIILAAIILWFLLRCVKNTRDFSHGMN